MAKYKCTLKSDFNEAYASIKESFSHLSSSTTLESEEHQTFVDINYGALVFERYSFFGGNRVSLSVFLVGNADTTNVMMFTSGGSQAILFKINTVGEETFLDKAIDCLKKSFKEKIISEN